MDGFDSDESTPLDVAALNRKADLVDLLLARGADVNRRDKNGACALSFAVSGGDTAVIRRIVEAGADPNVANFEGETPLAFAAARGRTEIVRALLEHGADPSLADTTGTTPLIAAGWGNQAEIVRLLLDAGADRASIGDLPRPSDGEAVVWYLGHSGFAVQVFASHEHRDHLSPTIYEWNDRVKDIAYVFGCRAEGAPPYEFMKPRQSRKVHGVKVTTIGSTDAGVGFVVEADGVTIFHAGDHANPTADLSDRFRDEIDWLASRGVRPDILLMPVRGCGLGDPESVKAGVYYAIETLRPRAFVPMHALNDENIYRAFLDECAGKFPETRMYAPEHKGDRFRYEKGTIS